MPGRASSPTMMTPAAKVNAVQTPGGNRARSAPRRPNSASTGAITSPGSGSKKGAATGVLALLQEKPQTLSPPKGRALTTRGVQIKLTAGSKIVWTTGKRVNKMIGFVDGKIAAAQVVREEAQKQIDANASMAGGSNGGGMLATTVKGSLVGVREAAAAAVDGLHVHAVQLRVFEVKLSVAWAKMLQHDKELNLSGKPGMDAKPFDQTKLQIDVMDAGALADAARAECVLTLKVARDHSIKIEQSRSLMQMAARKMSIANSLGQLGQATEAKPLELDDDLDLEEALGEHEHLARAAEMAWADREVVLPSAPRSPSKKEQEKLTTTLQAIASCDEKEASTLLEKNEWHIEEVINSRKPPSTPSKSPGQRLAPVLGSVVVTPQRRPRTPRTRSIDWDSVERERERAAQEAAAAAAEREELQLIDGGEEGGEAFQEEQDG